MTVRFNEQVYLFEFKVVAKEAEGRAIQQIREKAVRRQIPGVAATHPPDWRGIQQKKTQCGRVRGGASGVRKRQKITTTF
jgi:hypothetical protein